MNVGDAVANMPAFLDQTSGAWANASKDARLSSSRRRRRSRSQSPANCVSHHAFLPGEIMAIGEPRSARPCPFRSSQQKE